MTKITCDFCGTEVSPSLQNKYVLEIDSHICSTDRSLRYDICTKCKEKIESMLVNIKK